MQQPERHEQGIHKLEPKVKKCYDFVERYCYRLINFKPWYNCYSKNRYWYHKYSYCKRIDRQLPRSSRPRPSSHGSPYYGKCAHHPNCNLKRLMREYLYVITFEYIVLNFCLENNVNPKIVETSKANII